MSQVGDFDPLFHVPRERSVDTVKPAGRLDSDTVKPAGRLDSPNPWLDAWGRSADDPDFEEYEAELGKLRAAQA